MKDRKIDYIIGFFICLIINSSHCSLPIKFKDIFELICGSIVFGIIFGGITNFVFKKRKK